MYEELIDNIISGKIRSRRDLQRAKIDFCSSRGINELPTNTQILESATGMRHTPDDYRLLRNFLKLKPVRSLSGVVVVAVMSSPAPCPHGKCVYCPGGVENGSPQSYTGKEPAALRGVHGNFDPYLQTRARLVQLDACGHPTDKVEMIIMGGTFPARPPDYQEWFVKRCFDAMNGAESKTIADAHSLNMTAPYRCTGLTVESRPDWCREPHVDRMLSLGATRVELGVQTVFDEILQRVGRCHTVQDTIDATRISRDAGLKVGYHMMPGLPGSTPEKDIDAFRTIFENPDFKPDFLKIYPTLVIKGTRLYDDWKAGKYEPYTTEQATELLAAVKKDVPRWVRIQRIQRDIPANLIEAGVKKSHLRILVKRRMDEKGSRCACIRCREIGLAHRYGHLEGATTDFNAEMARSEYDAGGGTELFISIENRKDDTLIGYARLRFPSEKAHRPEIRENSAAIIRELKVHGEVVRLDEDADGAGEWQHRGYGKKLMDECEKLSAEKGCRMLLVNSGIGVKPYYRRLGYTETGGYMGRTIM